MSPHIVVIGTGEMSVVFNHGVLKQGYPIFPFIRQMNSTSAWAARRRLGVPTLRCIAARIA